MKIKIFVFILYLISFSPVLLEVVGLKEQLFSYNLFIIDLSLLYICGPSLVNNRFNLFVFICVLVISIFTYVTHSYSIMSHINGFREIMNIFLIFSYLEDAANSKYRYQLGLEIKKFIKRFLLFQIPITLFQFFKFGASDFVGGSLGAGNSGVLTLIIILMVYLLIKKNLKRHKYNAYLNSVFLFPLFINETKISFILIPLMFILLADNKKISTFIISIMGGCVFFLLLNTYYSNNGNTYSNPLEQIFNVDKFNEYIIGKDQSSKKETITDVPRITKIIIGSKLIGKDINESLFGIEYGAFKGGKLIGSSDFSRNYKWLLLGSRPYLFYLLITGGLVLTLLIIYFFMYKIFYQFKASPNKKLLLLCLFLLLTILVYDDSPRNQIFLIMFAYFITYSKKQRMKLSRMN